MVTPTVGGAEGTKYPSNFDDFKKKSPFTAETLTKKDHDEPELHFIGDALPVPSKVSTIGSVPSLGTSPIPAREDHVHIGGDLSTSTIRITGEVDASLVSTAHPFQIGPTNDFNLIIDANEIIARNNGALADLIFQNALSRFVSDAFLVGKSTSTNVADSPGAILYSDGRIYSILYEAVAGLQLIRASNANAVGAQFARFGNSVLNTYCGSINLAAGSTVTYAGTSDRRLKNELGPVDNAIARMQRLRPIHFSWKSDKTEADGFLADEVQQVVPQAVVGEPGAVDENGEIEPQSMDPGKLIPLLTAALQEAVDRIEVLETRLAALEV